MQDNYAVTFKEKYESIGNYGMYLFCIYVKKEKRKKK